MRRWCAGWAYIGLLLAAAAAQELYDDRQNLDDDPVYYQDENMLDIGSLGSHMGPGKHLTKDILLYNFIHSLKQQVPWKPNHRPDWFLAPDYEEAIQHEKDHQYHTTIEKDRVVKRLAEALKGSRTGKVPKRLERHGRYNPPQPKHKIGTRMVCYFKICAFRP